MKRKKKTVEMMTSISYQIKFLSRKSMDDLVEKLDDEATQNFQIELLSHSGIKEFRKQLKIKAIQAAREKANYLAESINEKAAEAITITEPEDSQPRDNSLTSNSVLKEYSVNKINENSFDKIQEVNLKKIKLRYEVNVVFALK
jgi:uncharacterized protein YggE